MNNATDISFNNVAYKSDMHADQNIFRISEPFCETEYTIKLKSVNGNDTGEQFV